MSEKKWLNLADCCNPALSLALALSDGRLVRSYYGAGHDEYMTVTVGNSNGLIADVVSGDGVFDLSMIRIERRQEPEGVGPCPVCGETPMEANDFGYRLISCQNTECMMCDIEIVIEIWNRLRLVD